MTRENAEANLKNFGAELNLELNFDENLTCILGIDNKFSLHITYEPNTDRLYVYSPLLDGLPQNEKHRLHLYETLLKGSMLGGGMAGGGVGVAVKEELILMHIVIEMGLGNPNALKMISPLFVQEVEKWRERLEKISQGETVEYSLAPPGGMMPGMGGAPGGAPQPPTSGGPNQNPPGFDMV